MSKRPKRKFSEEVKRKAVEDYTTGCKTAAEVAKEIGIAQGQVYQWKVQLEEKRIKGRVGELESDGRSPSDARLLQQKEDEIAMYQKKVAELIVVNDLLKKLQPSEIYPQLKNASGSDEIAALLAQSKKRARR